MAALPLLWEISGYASGWHSLGRKEEEGRSKEKGRDKGKGGLKNDGLSAYSQT